MTWNELPLHHAWQDGRLDLAGRWLCALDPDDRGLAAGWFEAPPTTAVPVQLPGSTDTNALGEPAPVTHLHPTRRHAYVGVTWWCCRVAIPAEATRDRLELLLERCHWTSEVWLGGRRLGRRDSLSVAHRYLIDADLVPGEKLLAVRVDNRLHLGVSNAGSTPGAHSVTEHSQSNWNGLIGELCLRRRCPRRIEDLRVTTAADLRRITVDLLLTDDAITGGPATLRLLVCDDEAVVVEAEQRIEQPCCALHPLRCQLDLGPGARPWSEHDPHRYRLVAELVHDRGQDRRECHFGLRHLQVEGTRLLANGRPLYLRGTVECAVFPRSGHPPCDVPSWRRVLGRVREHGLNHVRFHSWCPPEAAFIAADECGIWLQPEGPFWAELGLDDDLHRYIAEECRRIVDAYGNHPSFGFFAHGNEPHGDWLGKRHFLDRLVSELRHHDPRRLYTTAAGWPKSAASDYHCIMEAGGTGGWRGEGALRLHVWNQRFDGPLNNQAGNTGDWQDSHAAFERPCIVHEVGQWCVAPDYDEIERYDGVLAAGHLERFRDLAEAAGLLPLAPACHRASGRLQEICYKEEIERQLRTAAGSGFQLLQLNDFPGQGFAPVGLLDVFWNDKSYHDPATFRRFCGPTVALARIERFVWDQDESPTVHFAVAHHGAEPAPTLRPLWSLVDAAGQIRASGELPDRQIGLGNDQPLGSCRLDLSELPVPARYQLQLALAGVGAEIVSNSWDLWVYPPVGTTRTEQPGVAVCQHCDEELAARLQAGERVLLLPERDQIAGEVPAAFSPIFWNSDLSGGVEMQTLGLLIDAEHPALAHFPTASHSDWQWQDLVLSGRPLLLDGLQPLRGIVQVIDDWYRNRPLALLVDIAVGPGRLLICSCDLHHDLDGRPAARQLRQSLLQYLAGPLAPAAARFDDCRAIAGLLRAGQAAVAQ